MSSETLREPSRQSRTRFWTHILLIIAVAGAYQSLFIHHGIAWLFDEGWPLYAAMQLQQGGVLYSDVFFPFPPGHLLAAWIGHAMDPPGITLTRTFYALFTVALDVALYLLGRRLVSPRFALLGALLLTLAAPRSHLAHLLFGYRYFVFGVLALLAYAEYLRRGDRRMMILSGFATGVALYFRLTPAFAVACGVGVAVMAAHRDPRRWLRDWSLFGAGLLVVLLPMLAWFALNVGLDTVWRELVVRIIGLQQLQSKPIPEFVMPSDWDRARIYQSFVPAQYWLYMAMYSGYALVLTLQWLRAATQRRPFPHALLLALVICGGVYLLRTLGRSDEHHLTSALPPACLLMAHLSSLPFRSGAARSRAKSAAEMALCLVVLGAWVFLQGTDLYFERARRGVHAISKLGDEVFISSQWDAVKLDAKIGIIRSRTRDGDTVLDLTNAPLLHVVTGRSGPGYLDVVTPGVFMNEQEERNLIERMERWPPALVLWPTHPFDGMPSRSIESTAPWVARWVRQHYRPIAGQRPGDILEPKPSAFLRLRSE